MDSVTGRMPRESDILRRHEAAHAITGAFLAAAKEGVTLVTVGGSQTLPVGAIWEASIRETDVWLPDRHIVLWQPGYAGSWQADGEEGALETGGMSQASATALVDAISDALADGFRICARISRDVVIDVKEVEAASDVDKRPGVHMIPVPGSEKRPPASLWLP